MVRDPQEEAQQRKRWAFSGLALFVCLTALAGLLVGLYPSAASWMSARDQAKLIDRYDARIDNATPISAHELIQLAHRYNERLTSGASIDAYAHVPRGTGAESEEGLSYWDQLRVDGSEVMARLRIPTIDVDLPIYHGTSDETLLQGAGHLAGTSLPVGGLNTHSVITAHRGLASAAMFTNLDKVKDGDRFTIEVFDEVLTYEVRETKVVSPEDTESLGVQDGRDLVTLVTCTPLGVNTHRILVTAERVTPTPQSDIDAARAAAHVGFPWWAVILGLGIAVIALFFWRSGYMGTAQRRGRHTRAKDHEEDMDAE